ncbi:hypothetical protein BJX61DRAFT_545457 [Aspergillus egyptiacus]|nr:hypothetical protein BJX61DRAFT_545457 [Aspergillus egyptiacus]
MAIPLISIFLAIAGITLVFTRHVARFLRGGEAARVVVEGHTFSDAVEEKRSGGQAESRSRSRSRSRRVECVRRCCVVGAGRVGAVTGIVLAAKNPEVEFYIVDSDEELIAEWKSDVLPVYEPGLEGLLFADHATEDRSPSEETPLISKPALEQSRRRLSNLTFSTNIHAAVAAADLVFVCVDVESSELTLRTIAHASRGHKILVQRTTAANGAVPYIKNAIKEISSPTASFTFLSNPEFTLPGTTVQDTLHPVRVIIGHIYGPESSSGPLSALKNLYTSWIPEEKIVTMDAWSAELGRIVSKAVLSQQMASLEAIRMLCEESKANTDNIGWMLGRPDMGGLGLGLGGCVSNSEVRCLIYLARALELSEVAEYWESVLKMEAVGYRRLARRVAERLRGDDQTETEQPAVAVTGCMESHTGWLTFIKELRSRGVCVQVFDPLAKGRIANVLRAAAGEDGIKVVASLEQACEGTSAVVLISPCRFERERWQRIGCQMKEPKMVVDLGGAMAMDALEIQQLGFSLFAPKTGGNILADVSLFQKM